MMTDTTPHGDVPPKMPWALSSSVIEALASSSAASIGTSWNGLGVDTSWANALGPDSSALADIARNALGDSSALADISRMALGDSSPFMADIGRNTLGGNSTLADIARNALADSSALADIARNTLGGNSALADIAGRNALGDSSALADISRMALGDSSAFTALADIGRNTLGGNSALGSSALGALAAPRAIEGRIGAPWIKELGGGGICGPGDAALVSALSPTSLVEELSPSLERVDVSGLSVSTQSSEFLRWPCDAKDLAAMVIALSVLSVVLFFHAQGLDWAVSAATVLSSLLISLVLRNRS